MSSVLAPFGLRPAYSPSGIIRPGPTGTIESGYSTTIYQYSPVLIDADGYLEACAPNSRAMGCFLGCQYTDVEGRYRVSNRWVANTVATEIVAFYMQSQSDIVYEIQANATMSIANVGQQFDWSALSGNDITGLSSVSLNVSATAANAGLRVTGLREGPDNVWGDDYPVVLVQISEHQLVADVAGF